MQQNDSRNVSEL